MKKKDIVENNFLISVNYKGSCCEHITGGVNIYFNGCVTLLAPECAVCICVIVYVISNHSTSKRPYCVSDLSKLLVLR